MLTCIFGGLLLIAVYEVLRYKLYELSTLAKLSRNAAMHKLVYPNKRYFTELRSKDK